MTFEQQVEEALEMQKAPPGKFRALGVDTFTNPLLGEPYVVADCDDKQTAIDIAKASGGPCNPHYVYKDQGQYVFGA